MRPSQRSKSDLRTISIETNISPYAEGSCLIKIGNTHVLCTASMDDFIPPFLKGKGKGWVTAEYSMLPRSTHTRMKREVNNGKLGGRTQEIQRLIGRSLRSVTNLNKMGERQIIVDCDVLQADGGTRTASITGGYVALYLAFNKLKNLKIIKEIPLRTEVAAISCGIYKGEIIVDLDYIEDSAADVDANFVMSGDGNLVEIQGTAERGNFSEAHLQNMLTLAKNSIAQLIKIQRDSLGIIND